MKNTKYKLFLFLLVSKYMPVVIAIGIFINIILAIVYEPLLIVNIIFGSSVTISISNLKATRPYQDALIQCDIRRVAEHADFNLWRRTCRMITGEVVLPNTPVVTGYGSYNACCCNNVASAPAT